MEYRQLKYILKTAEEKSFSLAAKKLYISQPSLSQLIAKTEEKIGAPLFDRSATPIQLTYIGEMYVEMARQILDIHDQFCQKAADANKLHRGRLTIGSTPFRNTYLLSQVIPAFTRRYPGIELILKEDTTRTLEELTAQGLTDFSLSLLPLRTQIFDYEVLFEEDILLALPAEHPVSRAHAQKQISSHLPVIDLAVLKDTPFILMNQGQKLHQTLFELCQQAGFKPRILLETESMNAAQALAGAGMGAALLPDTLVRASQLPGKNPCYFRLSTLPRRTVTVIYRKGRYLSASARAFIDTLRQFLHPND